MMTIFDKSAVHGLCARIELLSGSHQRQWGKMDVSRMVRHCIMGEEMFLGIKQYQRLFAGRLFGKMALKGIVRNDDPMKRNQPTHPLFRVTGPGDLEAEKKKWISLLKAYEQYSNPGFIHPFFGAMTKEQVGLYVYKHTDHHLRQFGC